MMKVRAWNNDLKQFFYIGDSFSISLHDTGNKVIMWSSDGIVDEFDADEVCLFTGLSDKNGIEIYEGDIVDYEGEWVDLVEFSEGNIWIASNHALTSSDLNMGCIEVIGNIYQNPELLEAKS